MAGPLDGIRYLDLAPMGPGGHTSRTLADMGADVIRIEEVAPATGRRAGRKPAGPGSSGYSMRRNTRGIGLNLKSDEGKEVFYKLAATADAMGVGYRPSVPKRLGIDYDTVKKINPRIIYASLTGYGTTGPYAEYVGHDINYQAIGGMVALTGPKGGHPYVSGTVADSAGGGMQGVIAILAAVIARGKTGRGQFLDIAATDGIINMAHRWIEHYLDTGEVLTRGTDMITGRDAWFNIYKCKDGKYISLGTVEPWFYDNLCRLLGRDDLKAYQHDESKQEEMKKTFESIFLTKTRDEWFKVLGPGDTCAGPVYEMNELVNDPQLLHRKMIVEVPHKTRGKVKLAGLMLKFSDTPCEIKWVAPELGEHTGEILGSIGYKAPGIKKLLASGNIK